MADDRARKYADWLVANQDKKGTPEFDTVAKAYKAAREQAPAQPAQPEQQQASQSNIVSDLAKSTEATLRGAGRGFFGVGDNLLAANEAAAGVLENVGRAVTGQPTKDFGGYQGALERQRARTEQVSEEAPLAAAGGTLAGALVPVPGSQATAPARVGKAGDAFARALKLTKGQPLANTARTAVSGATSAAVTEANLGGSGEDIASAAALGAVAAPAVGGAARAIGAGVNTVRNVVDKADDFGYAALAKGMGKQKVNAADLRRRAAEFKAATGRTPTLQEVFGKDVSREIGIATGSGLRNIEAKRILTDAAEQSRVNLQDRLASGIQNKRLVTGADTVGQRNKKILDFSIGKIGKRPVTLGDSDIAALTQGVNGRLLAREAPRAFARVRASSQNGGRISLRDADTIRQALNNASGSATGGEAAAIKGLSDHIRAIAEQDVPEYADALTAASRRGRFREGVSQGSKVLSAPETEFRQAASTATKPELRGQVVGARTALRDAASGGPKKALRTGLSLAEDTGLNVKLSSLDPREAKRLTSLAKAEVGALDSVNSSLKGTKLGDALNEELADTRQALDFATLTTNRFSGGFLNNVLVRTIRRYGVPPTAATKLAKAVTDPTRTDEVIAILERAGVEPDAAQKFARGVSRAAGRYAGTSSEEN